MILWKKIVFEIETYIYVLAFDVYNHTKSDKKDKKKNIDNDYDPLMMFYVQILFKSFYLKSQISLIHSQSKGFLDERSVRTSK